jgi:hypothetical protein
MLKYSIEGLQQAQAAVLQAANAAKPRNALGKAVKDATTRLHRYAVGVTHVDTGSLRASHHIRVTGTRGEVYIDPGAVNPRSGERPVKYGVYEHKRGGSHAFYRRTVDEHGDAALQAAGQAVMRALP